MSRKRVKTNLIKLRKDGRESQKILTQAETHYLLQKFSIKEYPIEEKPSRFLGEVSNFCVREQKAGRKGVRPSAAVGPAASTILRIRGRKAGVLKEKEFT